MHISSTYKDDELGEERTYKKILLLCREDNRSVQRNKTHYNPNMTVPLGYPVKSQVVTCFRRWATQLLHENILKGFARDDERVKQRGRPYFCDCCRTDCDIRIFE